MSSPATTPSEPPGEAFQLPPDADGSRARVEEEDRALLPPQIANLVNAFERVHEAIDELETQTERAAARRLGARWGVSQRQAYKYVQGALVLLATGNRMSPAERRAVLAERNMAVMRKAMSRKKGVLIGSGSDAYVELVEDPDLRAAQAANDFEAKLYGIADAQSDQRAIVLVMDVAKAVLEPAQWATLAMAIAKASGREAQLPAGSGTDGDDG